MADDATSHHPAKMREDLLSNYLYGAYRDLTPVAPTPLPWAQESKSPLKPHLIALLAHYTMPRTPQRSSLTQVREAPARRRRRSRALVDAPDRRPCVYGLCRCGIL
ncbi:MAG: hypothetical protein WDM89_03540 [Rhizomicrobium sp.]